ncbi:MAG: hypothetical protein M0Q96_04455, partial [Candidatus Omnitrophica bacterium]|nr:hypothetical protein [Candidatus Omnitrophota bacterium]
QDDKFSEGATPKKMGRTHSDLFLEIKDDPRCVVAFLTITSFVMFSFQLSNLSLTRYLKISLVTSFIFSVVWFCTPVIIYILKKLKR